MNTGGAEMMLYRLLSRMDASRFSARVVSITGDGPVGEKIRALGIPVRTLGMRRPVSGRTGVLYLPLPAFTGAFPNPFLLLRLAGWLRAERPSLVQTWMYHADLIGGLAARLAGRMPVVWGLHNSTLDPKLSKRTTLWTVGILARLSHSLPVRIISCSEAARRLHVQWGYEAGKLVVIPNGFDVQAYRPDPAARLSVRQELGLEADAPLLGYIARFDPQKDHATFVQAASLLHRRMPNAHFLLAGEGITWENETLARWVDEARLRQVTHLLGRRDDVPRLMAALDLATLTSAYGEAFPLVVGEAMACGVPCVVSDVGDAALLVGDTGLAVAPGDAPAFTEAWGHFFGLPEESRRQTGLRARQRILDNYLLDSVVRRYENLYREIVATLGAVI